MAGATGGLWKTIDNGVTFKPVFEHEPVHSIGCVGASGGGGPGLDRAEHPHDHGADARSLHPVRTDAHLFHIAPAAMIRYTNPRAHTGDMVLRGENPATGALIDYYLREVPAGEVSLSIHDPGGAQITQITPTKSRGINRVVWDLRYPPLPRQPVGGSDEGESGSARLPGVFVVPGPYTVRLSVGGRTYEQPVVVNEDPRITISPAERKIWTDTLLTIADLYKSATALQALAKATDKQAGGATAPPQVYDTTIELASRLATLYTAVSRSTGPLTEDQRSQLDYFSGLIRRLREEVR